MQFDAGELLSKINDPSDLKKLNEDQLEQVSQELRQYIIDLVSVNGGHFAASLGVVELTVALHYVMNTPYDQLIWDVGHQAYGHKILTGRRDSFHTNRIVNGLSGFPKRGESEYDAFGVGHSSTSISAALGMAVASHIKGEKDRQHIAIIGDGAMTGGMAFEALNHAGIEKSNLLVILNDNCMSIDPNVGALKEYLTSITTSKRYNRFRDDIGAILSKISEMGPNALGAVKKLEKSIKGTLLKNANLFESLNFRYFGPVDGHDVKKLAKTLEDLRHIPGPKLLHCVTMKGKGYALAEKDQTKWHAPGLFDKITGEIKKSASEKPTAPKYQDVFGTTLVELAEMNDKIVGITPAMPSGSSMNIMMKAFPERSFDVGIAEQHAVTFSAGLATQGLMPFCNIYSSFMQRAFDQVIHDVALQKLNVVFCLDRAGVVGADGPTHHGAYDIAFMRCIPNMTVSAPMNEEELRNLMYTAQLEDKGPFVIRYPRGNGVMIDWKKPFKEIEIGKGRLIQDGEGLAILSFGAIGNEASKAILQLAEEGIHPAHYDLRFAKPLDEELLHKVLQKFENIITVEDGCLQGGIGSAVLEFMADHQYSNKVVRLGIPDAIIEHAEQKDQWNVAYYDAEAIATECRKLAKGIKTNAMVS
ncbi:1-deoxy-D-xylulose-5-phosphate synthase [Sphingobacterium sp. SRCM116780]|uniref:1-deoxy-D-xylulose-5-phosphate synthase n=1 Tax=Sphingobacterium sp. SRCM116780 TaxID=2907623 RepID=UPI001F012644|nr:1-deoxy-D-xylulose-5-phosphate synthase [Sphingobacterium sp. SRCM116780]UIR55743.1 1-deoxy-D-xylulose-5-phosphate synthase [Sphingobacterium sp. SRCM116780]